jgi:hypothetical protein
MFCQLRKNTAARFAVEEPRKTNFHQKRMNGNVAYTVVSFDPPVPFAMYRQIRDAILVVPQVAMLQLRQFLQPCSGPERQNG